MNHALDSTMLFIHPPLAILGYVLIIASFVFILLEYRNHKTLKFTKKSLYLAWFFNFVGLATGMIWAEIAWGSYWSWDPKETITLILFITVCLSAVFYETKKKISLIMLVISLMMITVNIMITLGCIGLHSYGG